MSFIRPNFLNLAVVKTIRGKELINQHLVNGDTIVIKSEEEAYLVPPNLRIGCRVFIEDIVDKIPKIITTYKGSTNKTELEYHSDIEAIWDGKSLNYLVKPPKERIVYND
jgi:hypothetical protein